MNNFLLKHRYISSLLLGSLILAMIYFISGENQILLAAPPEKIPISYEEAKWIKKNPVISVGVDLDFAPIEYLDENNKYIGVTADFLALAEKKTGLVFEIDQSHSWEESIERIKTGKIHLLGAAVPSEQRKKFMDFTQAYAQLSGVIIVRKDVTEPMSPEKLKGMKVAVVHNYIWKDILETSYPQLEISPVPNIETALKKVSFGMADAMVGYMATASHHIERLGISNLKISGDTVSVLGISFAVSKQAPQLKSILNRVLELTPEARKKTILRKWISLEISGPVDLKLFTRILFPGVALVLFILIAIIIWNRSLRKKVTKRTEKLNQELFQRTRIEQALRESEEKYRSIFGNIQDVYYEITPHGQILEVSPSIEKVFGYKRMIILKKSLSYIFVNSSEFKEMLEIIIREERLTDHEIQLTQSDNKMLNCSMNAMLIKNDQGQPFKIIGSIRNITDRVKAQKALKTSYHELEKRVKERTAELRNINKALNKAKEEADAATLAKSNFLANMSHEIRTPLNGVISASELVMNESLPKKVTRYVNIINNSGHALLGVIDDILDFSKIEAGKLDIEIRPFLLNQLITRVTDLFKQKMALENIIFNVDIKPGTQDYLMGDSFRLQQILTNLLSNAVKFTDKGGDITLRISSTPDNDKDKTDPVQMTFTVSDTGIGIAPAHQNLLFTPFSQVDASTTRKYGGSGLGLSICGQLVEMMNGTITVESSPDKGSQFIFTIPLGLWENPEPEQIAQTPLPDRSNTISTYRSFLEGCRVLVAEDTPTNQEITLAVLELVGIKASLVDTGLKAVKAVQNQEFDAVLMDIQMPQMDGFEATRAIRRQKGKSKLPIIAMTAHTLKEDEAKCIEAGMDGYVSKPVRQEKLFKTLKALIQKENTDLYPVLEFTNKKSKTWETVFTNQIPATVPGIEMKKTINSLGVSPVVYLQILQTFLRSYETFTIKAKTAWRNQNREDLIILVHSLKGSAAGIGAIKLHDLAFTLEQLCRKTSTLPSMEKTGLADLENALSVVLASIKDLVSDRMPDPVISQHQKENLSVSIKSDPVKSRDILIRLGKALEFPELAQLEKLMENLEAVCGHPVMTKLKNQIAEHDHDIAKQTVKNLQTILEK